jgi:hypothetical protein
MNWNVIITGRDFVKETTIFAEDWEEVIQIAKQKFSEPIFVQIAGEPVVPFEDMNIWTDA